MSLLEVYTRQCSLYWKVEIKFTYLQPYIRTFRVFSIYGFHSMLKYLWQYLNVKIVTSSNSTNESTYY